MTKSSRSSSIATTTSRTLLFLWVAIAATGIEAATAEDDISSLLQDYNLVFHRCNSVLTYSDAIAESSYPMFSARTVQGAQRFATFRLCPINNNNNDYNCEFSDNYGEYLVDLDTYLNSTVGYFQERRDELCTLCQESCPTATTRSSSTTRQFLPTDVDCDTCAEECDKIENMRDNGYVDATDFLGCRPISWWPLEEYGQPREMFAGPQCFSNGTRIKIGVYLDEECSLLDPTNKEVEESMSFENILGLGYPAKLSYALLKQAYNKDSISVIPCSSSLGMAVCQELYKAAAKCEHRMGGDGILQQLGNSSSQYANQLQQEPIVCDYIAAIQQSNQDPPDDDLQVTTNLGPPTNQNDSVWFDNFSLRLESCNEFLEWNTHAHSNNEDVRLRTRRFAHYELCPTCDNYVVDGANTCGDYIVDLSEFLQYYWFAQGWFCDELNDCVAACQQHEGNDPNVNCLARCNHVTTTANRTCPLVTNDNLNDNQTKWLVPPGFLECAPLSSEFQPQDGGTTFYMGPYCGAEATDIRLGVFSDSSCTLLVSPEQVDDNPIARAFYSDTATASTLIPDSASCVPCHQGGRACKDLYDISGKCESNIQSLTRNNRNACDYLGMNTGNTPPSFVSEPTNGTINENYVPDEYSFLMNYEAKLLHCKAGEPFRNPETGEVEDSVVVYRLCPDGGCDSDSERGCSSGYGEFAMGIQSFVNAYMRDQRDHTQSDDAFDVEEYAACRQYFRPQNEDGQPTDTPYFVGPSCTKDGKDIRLEVFMDSYCSQVAEDVTFEDLSGGWSLPYEHGGLVSTACLPCISYDGNGQYVLRDMCLDLYLNSGKCETRMERFHYYGKQTEYCEYIHTLYPPDAVEEENLEDETTTVPPKEDSFPTTSSISAAAGRGGSFHDKSLSTSTLLLLLRLFIGMSLLWLAMNVFF